MDDSRPKSQYRPLWPYETWDLEEEQLFEITSDTVEMEETGKSLEEVENKKRSQEEETSPAKKSNAENAKVSNEKENVQIKDESFSENEESLENIEEQDDEQSDKDATDVPEHWTDELNTSIPDNCPINNLLNAIASPDISSTQEAEDVKSAIFPMVEETLKDLTSRYMIFEDSYVLPVGSMAEQTKVHRADEFDFAIILPLLADERYHEVLCNKKKDIQSPSLLEVMNELISGDPTETFRHFQQVVRKLWSLCMVNYIPEGWHIYNPSGHSDDQSVAATFHLERKSDKITVDLDVCFWVPLDADGLSKIPTERVPQKEYLLNHCLDSKGLIYAVLPQDSNICHATNSIRFAMSTLEKETLLKYGPENGRLQCYRLSKCIVAAFLPKVRKSEDCSMCYNGLVSSYCLKNIVLYMVAYYKDDLHWTVEKIPNRIFEVFYLLTFCMKVNCGVISAYFTPYQLDIDMYMAYNPDTKCVEDKSGVYELNEDSLAQENDSLIEIMEFDHSEDSMENGNYGDTKDGVSHGKTENQKENNPLGNGKEIKDGSANDKNECSTENGKSEEKKEITSGNKSENWTTSTPYEECKGSMLKEETNKSVGSTPCNLSEEFNTSFVDEASEISIERFAEDKSNQREHIQCILPNFDILKEKIEDRPSSQALRDYEDFLNNSKWRYPEVLCRLSELLTVLVFPDEEDREDMVKEPGWNCFGLPMPENYV